MRLANATKAWGETSCSGLRVFVDGPAKKEEVFANSATLSCKQEVEEEESKPERSRVAFPQVLERRLSKERPC